MRLYIARWPDGSAYLLSAASMEDVADLLDAVGDPGVCEVQEFEGPIAFGVKLAPNGAGGDWLTIGKTEAESEYDMALEILKTAYPHAHAAAASDEVNAAAWKKAVAAETQRELRPSPEWARAVAAWWTEMGGPPDRTAAMRAYFDVTIPGEPKPETPQQQAMFERAQRELGQKIASAPLFDPPPPPKPRPPTKKPGKKK